jgi:hypothetical protein
MNQELNLVPHLSPQACKTRLFEIHPGVPLQLDTCYLVVKYLLKESRTPAPHSKLLHPDDPLLLLLIVNDGQRNEWSFADAKGPKRSLFTSSSFRFDSEGKLAKQV